MIVVVAYDDAGWVTACYGPFEYEDEAWWWAQGKLEEFTVVKLKGPEA